MVTQITREWTNAFLLLAFIRVQVHAVMNTSYKHRGFNSNLRA